MLVLVSSRMIGNLLIAPDASGEVRVSSPLPLMMSGSTLQVSEHIATLVISGNNVAGMVSQQVQLPFVFFSPCA
jgi:hypothetical protein